MFASEWIDGGVNPDILICAKGIANGFPLSAIATRNELSIKQPPGSMGGTYGGNAVSCAAALAVLDAFEKEKIIENVQNNEKEIRKNLDSLLTNCNGLIREVRGKGLMIGVEFESLPNSKHGQTSSAVVAECIKRDLMVLSCGPYETVRLIPPLNISSDELAIGMKKFGEAIQAVGNQMKK